MGDGFDREGFSLELIAEFDKNGSTVDHAKVHVFCQSLATGFNRILAFAKMGGSFGDIVMLTRN